MLKEAVTLAANGYSIDIITTIYSNELHQQDHLAIGGLNIRLHFITNSSARDFWSLAARMMNKTGKLLNKYLGIQTLFALGYAPYQYLKKAIAVNADLYICHQELASYVGTKLLALGFKVAFDIEDWYSEDLLPVAKKERPVKLLQQVESIALTKGTYVTTTSNTLANVLAKQYGSKTPVVIYNVFPPLKNTFANKTFAAPVKLFWFSQTIGPGRGLEKFIKLLNNLKEEVQLHLLGAVNEAYKNQLGLLIAKQHYIYFHPLVPENDLMRKIASFDIGLALESSDIASRDNTITNKFFQYLQAGLPIIATETAGQLEGFEHFKPGVLIPQSPNDAAIKTLAKWLTNPQEIALAAERAKQAALYYNWENESKKLIQLVADAVD